jgi:putative Mg2+ transporter-C (MgtC) family protein
MQLSTGALIARLLLAAALGALVGIEREASARGAGVRTHALVALGAALFTMAGAYGFSDISHPTADPARVAAQVAAGVGFIGAGAVLRHGVSVLGITTAATVWLAASIGVTAAAGGYAAALVATVLALLVLVALRSLKPLTSRLGRNHATIELEYTRGHGTLGPVLRALHSMEGKIQSLSVDDDDADASGDGTRSVTLDLRVNDPSDLDELVDTLGRRPVVRRVRVAGRDD